MLLESPVAFYGHLFEEIAIKAWRYFAAYRQCKAIPKEVLAAPDRWTYTDIAIAAPATDFTMRYLAARSPLTRRHRHEEIRSKVTAAKAQTVEYQR